MDSTFGGRGDFSALTPDPNFAVTQVLQQANITVGEEGTEAAAATAIVGEAGAVPPPPEGSVEFVADHPFAFAIMHDRSGVPLFQGVVADPWTAPPPVLSEAKLIGRDPQVRRLTVAR